MSKIEQLRWELAQAEVRIVERDKELAASHAREDALREALADLVANAEVNLADCGCCVEVMPRVLFERARAALAADPGQAAERVRAVVEAAREWKCHTDALYGSPGDGWGDAPRRLYEALVALALATPGKGEE